MDPLDDGVAAVGLATATVSTRPGSVVVKNMFKHRVLNKVSPWVVFRSRMRRTTRRPVTSSEVLPEPTRRRGVSATSQAADPEPKERAVGLLWSRDAVPVGGEHGVVWGVLVDPRDGGCGAATDPSRADAKAAAGRWLVRCATNSHNGPPPGDGSRARPSGSLRSTRCSTEVAIDIPQGRRTKVALTFPRDSTRSHKRSESVLLPISVGTSTWAA